MDGDESRRGHTGWTEYTGRYVMSVAVLMTGVDAYRIRKYEAVGFVRPARTEGGQRLFSDRDISRIREVAKLEDEGMNLQGIELIRRMTDKASGEPEGNGAKG